ncbi:hypothetical protein ACFLV7_06205 [Chloroflexota bacterium]
MFIGLYIDLNRYWDTSLGIQSLDGVTIDDRDDQVASAAVQRNQISRRAFTKCLHRAWDISHT